MSTKKFLILLGLISILTCNISWARYGAYTGGGAGDTYISAGANANTFATEDFSYGSINGGSEAMVFETDYSGTGGELTIGHVFDTPKKSMWKNFRFEGNVEYNHGSTEVSNVKTLVVTPPINGAFSSSFPSFQSTNTFTGDIDYIDVNLLIKSDIDTNFWGFIFTPMVGVNYTNLEQDYNLSSVPTSSGGSIQSMKLNENLNTTYYGLMAGLHVSVLFNETFSIFFGGGRSFMHANTEFTGTQTITSSDSTYAYSGAISETDSAVAQKTFFAIGAFLDSSIGKIGIIGKMDTLSYAPFISNPNYANQGYTSRAYIDSSEEMTISSVGLNYTYTF